ncbi:putative DNA protection during starvation protein [Caenibius tardaugens NBRC 16725]|uniref:Putative DNA protection during starvation protein n=1 Tax=Caenibius tardaugens NBRC 16725 TaxID=1219035 RepID=U2YPJ9_9SPHN|nr:DNA starvation/stationary phase protection protein [Caenibius tardaugens]AZI35828.1 DNA starvation/stationary phase protection protein [Caenibius tardaugens NBRC 16725]GAD50597.1 putative DNA protection during starvation protein [Caenibius tardaugens NBRC 16725]
MAKAGDNARKALVDELNGVLADHLALYIKTKSFHWHVAGPRFHDLHLLFDTQATAIFAVVDLIAERVRKNDADTLTSIGAIAGRTKVKDQDKTSLSAEKMVAELRDDNAALVARLKKLKQLAGDAGDNATDGLLDDWTDQAEQRVWFLSQTLK